jgi:uncharacterized membrane protein
MSSDPSIEPARPSRGNGSFAQQGADAIDTPMRRVATRMRSSPMLVRSRDAAPGVLGLLGLGFGIAALISRQSGARRAFAAASVTCAAASFTARRVVASAEGRSEAFVEESVAINKSPAECYAFWRNPTNVPRFSPMIQSVTALDERRYQWTARGPMGMRSEWTTEFTVDQPGEKLAWHTVDEGLFSHAGVVHFEQAPGGRGTHMKVSMHYRVPGGRAATTLAKLIGHDPESELREDLRRFRQLLETGEIATTAGQPSGRRSVFARMTREGRLSEQGAGR